MDDFDRLPGKRILVAEDEYFIASDLQRKLIAAGAVTIGPVATVAQALALCGEEAPDCAILDINLNGAPSFPVAERLRERSVPLLFLTGYDGWSIPDRYRDIPRIAKPYRETAVLATVEQLVFAGRVR